MNVIPGPGACTCTHSATSKAYVLLQSLPARRESQGLFVVLERIPEHLGVALLFSSLRDAPLSESVGGIGVCDRARRRKLDRRSVRPSRPIPAGVWH